MFHFEWFLLLDTRNGTPSARNGTPRLAAPEHHLSAMGQQQNANGTYRAAYVMAVCVRNITFAV